MLSQIENQYCYGLKILTETGIIPLPPPKIWASSENSSQINFEFLYLQISWATNETKKNQNDHMCIYNVIITF